MTTTLIVPGLNSSGAAHWQTWFESQISNTVRVIQGDWKRPDLPEWSSRVRREISRQSGPILIVAHSFGVLAAVQAAEDYRHRIAGALLVAPADPDKFGVADVLPTGPLGFPSTIVASTNDPWLRFERSVDLAALWGADLVDLGAAGHINTDAGYGPWPQGLALLRRLQSEFELRNQSHIEGQHVSRRLAGARPRLRERAGRASGGHERREDAMGDRSSMFSVQHCG